MCLLYILCPVLFSLCKPKVTGRMDAPRRIPSQLHGSPWKRRGEWPPVCLDDLGSMLPDRKLIRKLILSNGLFGSLARVATCLQAELLLNDNWDFDRFHSYGQQPSVSPVSLLWFPAVLVRAPVSSHLFFSLIPCIIIFLLSLVFIYLFSLSDPPPPLSALYCGHPITTRS